VLRLAIWLALASWALFWAGAVYAQDDNQPALWDTSGRQAAGRSTDVFNIGPNGQWRYSNGAAGSWNTTLATSRVCLDDLRFGDFDGDGMTDVFRIGASDTWQISYGGGRQPWTVVQRSGVALSSLRFGDFNGDGKTDIFSIASGGQWRYSSAGTARWSTAGMAQTTTPLSQLRFGDFDGDGRTDVFTILPGSQWIYYHDGGPGILTLRSDPTPLSQLRFGDFDGDGKTDAFTASGGRWLVSPGAVGNWREINTSSDPFESLRFGDFDGDGKTDLFHVASGGQWQISSAGATRWQNVQSSAADLTALRFGNFGPTLAAMNFSLWLPLVSRAGDSAVGVAADGVAAPPVDQAAPTESLQPELAYMDDAATVVPQERDMVAGRLSKLPVSWFYKTTVNFTNGLAARAVCQTNDCDTGMLVVANGSAWYNDDTTCNGGNGKGSFVEIEGSGQADIYVFSQHRATSQATIQVDRGGGWETLATENVGGALVKVGPLQNGDFLEVQSRQRTTGGSGNDDNTHMVLFNFEAPGNGARYSDNRSSGDWDPRVVVDSSGWQGAFNYAIVGKVARSTATNLGVEATVDLVHGPLDDDFAEAAFPGADSPGAGITLQPGRYYAWLYAATTTPVGNLDINPANTMPYDFCPSYKRGFLNQPAFTFWIERLVDATAQTWQAVTPKRAVPHAALGSAPGGGWNLFLAELKVDAPGTYRMRAQHDVATPLTTFFDKWRVERNPDANELAVVTYNVLYDDFPNDNRFTEEFRNTSNLLATRGSILRSELRVEERADQARWQWGADLIGLQEFNKYPNLQNLWVYGDVFVEEARLRGSLDWAYVKGRDEDFDVVGRSGFGPVFISENLWPTLDKNSIYFSTSARDYAGCTDGTLDYIECQLEGYGGITKATNYTIPGKIEANRFGSSPDRPIAAFNLHLEFRAEDSDTREKEMTELISTIDRLLEKDPAAFNAGAGNPDRTKPGFHQNRIIVFGDSNFMPHACGEHYWSLKKLRDHYGYAVDVSMLQVVNGDDFAMHDKLGRIDAQTYQTSASWQANPDSSLNSRYPWWAATTRGKTGGSAGRNERHDVILLVGKGWAYDDPLLAYQIMSDRDWASPFNPQGGGVEMWQTGNLVTNGGTNYAPNYDIGGGTGPGRPALHTDHLPVYARLRVFVR
jgi:hypothetical protein